MKRIGILTIHGIGTEESYTHSQDRLVKNIKKKLGKNVEVVVENIVYANEIQANQKIYTMIIFHSFHIIHQVNLTF